MALVNIQVPDIGDFKEVEVIEVLVSAGDTIKAEQSLITVESDKASMEIPASAGGVVKSVKVKVGDKVKVQVIDVDEGRERINLSMKALTQDPWEGAVDRYSIGQKVKGKVTNLTNFGAFIELEPGLEGLVHVSEMSWTKRVRHPNEVMKEGDEVEALIAEIAPARRPA